MRRLLVGEAQCRASKARYYLLEEDAENPGAYGVQIELDGEEASVPDLRVLELADTLVRGVVTPVGLRDVVDDWLLE